MNYVIIVAGGKGERMGSSIPKQFLSLGRLPVLAYTIQAFARSRLPLEIIVVLPASQQATWRRCCAETGFTTAHTVVTGGDTRFHSVQQGLSRITDTTGITLVHDGVRPLVSQDLIRRVAHAAAQQGAAIPCIPLTDSMRHISTDALSSQAVDRSQYQLVQTPQGFATGLLLSAYTQPYASHYTDDASVVEHLGATITLVPGASENLKITTPLDLLVARQLLAHP